MWGCALLLWTFLSRRGAYRLLDGELAVLLALLEVIDVEPRTPLTLQNGADAGASSVGPPWSLLRAPEQGVTSTESPAS